jgi:excisionase family DNA binding protein
MMRTQTELAEHLNVSKRTVMRLTQNKKIPCIKVGRCIRYDTEQVEKALTVLPTKALI